MKQADALKTHGQKMNANRYDKEKWKKKWRPGC